MRWLSGAGVLLLGVLTLWSFPGLAGEYDDDELRGALPVWVGFAGLFFLYHAVSTAVRFRQSRVWHITVDWPTQRLELATRSGTVEVPTAELREIELRGIVRHGHHRTGGTHRAEGGTGGTPDQYRMSVVLHLETGDEATSVMMLETNAMQRQCPLVVYQYMLSFVTDLARALGVPHRFSDFRESGEYPWKVE